MLLALVAGLGTACHERDAPIPSSPPQHPDVALYQLYNRGTHLLRRDSLWAALAPLDSAGTSTDRQVRYRTTFNSGWAYYATGVRLMRLLGMSGPARDSALAATLRAAAARNGDARDSGAMADASRRAVGDSVRDSQGNSDDRAAGTPAPPDSVRVQALAVRQLTTTVARYRVALTTNPNDGDAKWNYELALIAARNASNVNRGNNRNNSRNTGNQRNPQNTRRPGARQRPRASQRPPTLPRRKGRTAQTPPIERLRLPLQQAAQLLNATGQHAQQAAKGVQVPMTPPPQGKDW